MLASEQDVSTKRNAFQMLCLHAQPLAVKYLLSQVDSVALWGDILQIASLDLIAKVRWQWPHMVATGMAWSHDVDARTKVQPCYAALHHPAEALAAAC